MTAQEWAEFDKALLKAAAAGGTMAASVCYLLFEGRIANEVSKVNTQKKAGKQNVIGSDNVVLSPSFMTLAGSDSTRESEGAFSRISALGLLLPAHPEGRRGSLPFPRFLSGNTPPRSP